MNDLEAVTTFRVPHRVLEETAATLGEAGRREIEAWVLWVGRFTGTAFQIEEVRVPRQQGTLVSCVVDHDALVELFDELRAANLHLAIQVHSHPGAAFHSATDNEHPIATQYGSLSIVVPNFCENGLDGLDTCTVFRLGRMGWCGPLPKHIVRTIIEVTP